LELGLGSKQLKERAKMLRLLKRLFGKDVAPTRNLSDAGNGTQGIIQTSIDTGNSSEYFATLSKLQEAISKRNCDDAARLARKNVRQIPNFVRSTQQEYGSFDISSIPALEEGGTMLALAGDDNGLKEMRQIVSSIPELAPWISFVNRHEEDTRLFASILKAVDKNPGCLQTDLKKIVEIEDGRRIANLTWWLEKAGRLNRAKKGQSYVLMISNATPAAAPLPKRQVKSHRTDKNPMQCSEVDLRSLPYLPLPKAPLRWEETKGGQTLKPIEAESELFELHDSSGWKLLSVEKLKNNERPDPAFRRIHPIDTGLIMVNDHGSGSAPAAAVRFGREGNRVVDAPLYHDIYRIGVNALGRGLIAMSRECVVHAYDDALKCILETSLCDSPEVHALQQRLGISDAQLKNHLRCVTMAYDNSRYLSTGVDEAWCVNMDGRSLWGVKLPVKDGWSRVTEPSNNFGTNSDISRALEVMNLTLPFTAEDVKQSYRKLAKQWHPDLNPEKPNAEEQMKAVNSAAGLLTGIDTRAIPRYAGATFMKEYNQKDFFVGNKKFTITMGMQVSEVQAADWIYAASFSGRTQDVFLSGYSGKIVQVNGEGQPMRAYDIGAVPRQIIDTGDYLYLLTDTRLYTLRGDSLVALMDTSESGELIVAQTGFGLFQRNCFQWFSQDGTHIGTIAAKNPIRWIYYTPQGMVVETRQHRAIVGGVTSWWK
jgi:hypothetical protein